MKKREAIVERKTEETNIKLAFLIEGEGESKIKTGVPFMEHMLDLFTKHGLFDLQIEADGDLEVDGHHTVEDLGLCLGEALEVALEDKGGINRYGSVILPMDDALVLVAVDLSGRPYLSMDLNFTVEKIGNFDTELIEEFLRAFSFRGKFNLHVKQLSGHNNHHLAEGVFKGLGRALAQACAFHPRVKGVPSTKGVLE